MDTKIAARCLAELGSLTRLDIYRLLVRAGPAGLKITDIQGRLDLPASTLAFHLRGLVDAGLVAQEKSGRAVFCRVQYSRMDAVIDFLREQCCEGFAKEPPAIKTRRAR
ncbi:helix-turn-helix transcriptional regulator [Bradyrhizobium diazoefficiens]|nr:helix-turn-helix domain-containing protein [Bradyrhizobium diazoefficiens]MBR0965662.1 helix-turn-helix transcriptional regulator [Bradyrhizobium diazoefficiens]MBR0979354.1 helix-turn-helix transcriptional regulator [Bradyrhizobium diazoefficiens]MBR1008546.1 helix-turn-helix transcriptional regulator [Bradyrhizobium diazoefficiens]MBR1014705.1 helix-turn-helix transcriptional regulator [Bradyrhizobium diazoefficiens]MBR1052507.1 helix-turn-helix transcriptional regulator [Bradyrhizobium d